jgi:lipid II:glycine glycyltransferase (peptidoglycan interpeptide bridge formation enzyme)
MITNPFTDTDFAKLQELTQKATHTYKLPNSNFAYVFHLKKNFTLLYATANSRRLTSLAKKHNAVYTLIESYEKVSHSTKNPLKQIVPRHTVLLDLNQSKDTILNNMHPKGRYNIRLAEKKGVTIKQVFDTKQFYQILKDTADRDNFFINSEKYYQTFFTHLSSKNKAKLFMAYYKDQPIAGILNAYFNKTAIYYYGASSNQHRNLMAPYLLQWHAICDAKEQGYTHYDLLGVANPNNPKDPLQGVTYFKQKFGGKPHKWPDSRIIIHKPFLYFLLKIKKLFKRNF